MCDQEKASNAAWIPPTAQAQAGVGYGILAGAAPISGARADPMHMTVGHLMQSFSRLQDEKRFLETEVSRLKLRVAQLEHEKSLRA